MIVVVVVVVVDDDDVVVAAAAAVDVDVVVAVAAAVHRPATHPQNQPTKRRQQKNNTNGLHRQQHALGRHHRVVVGLVAGELDVHHEVHALPKSGLARHPGNDGQVARLRRVTMARACVMARGFVVVIALLSNYVMCHCTIACVIARVG